MPDSEWADLVGGPLDGKQVRRNKTEHRGCGVAVPIATGYALYRLEGPRFVFEECVTARDMEICSPGLKGTLPNSPSRKPAKPKPPRPSARRGGW